MDCISDQCEGYTSGAAGSTFLTTIKYLITAQCLVKEQWPESAKVSNGSIFDFIIVGAGTAGSVVANRLTEVEGWRVLLIEAGGDPPMESVIPYFSESLLKSEYDWQHQTENDGEISQALQGGAPIWSAGKMLGGSDSLGNMVYVRGNEADYTRWRDEGNENWDWDTVLYYFKKSEKMEDLGIVQDGDEEFYHATDGLLNVGGFNYTNPELASYIKSSFIEIGMYDTKDFNAFSQMGISEKQGTLYRGRRVSSATAFLNPVSTRPNLKILKNTFVKRILINHESRHAKGVSVVLKSGKTASFYASKEVIISAGTVNTANILLNSGVGPDDVLDAHDIPSVTNSPVGKRIKDQIFVPVTITGNQDVAKYMDISSTLLASAQYLTNQSGPYASDRYPDIIGFLKISENYEEDIGNRPDFQIEIKHFDKGSTLDLMKMCSTLFNYIDEVCDSFLEMNSDKQLFIISVTLLHPQSFGRIYLKSSDSLMKPFIKHNYFSNIQDRKLMVKGLKRVAHLVNTTYFSSINAKVRRIKFSSCNGNEFLSDEYWECIASNLVRSNYGPIGSARMGPASSSSVVDDDLRVHGVNSLRVVDASVIPSTISGHLNAPIMMIAERASDLIKKYYGIE